MFVCVCILEQRDFDMFPCSRSEQQRSPATDGHTWSLQSAFASVRVHPRTSVHHQPWPLWSDTTLGLIVPPNSLSGARWQPAPSFIPFLSLTLQYPFSHPPPQVSPQARALPLTVDQPLVASLVPPVKRQIVRQPELLWIQPWGLGLK